jgi:hypothetical protein
MASDVKPADMVYFSKEGMVQPGAALYQLPPPHV